LRDYGVDGQIGLEATPDAFVSEMVLVFREVRRVLRSDGTLWLNLGDSYSSGGQKTQVVQSIRRATPRNIGMDAASGKQEYLNGTAVRPPVVAGLGAKQLLGIPWRVAFALQADGWYLRQDIIWHKPNPMPESVKDRCTKAHEYLFLLTKSEKYYFDAGAMQEPAVGASPGNTRATKAGREYARGEEKMRTSANLHKVKARETRNRRSVWTVPSKPFKGAHFATFPPALIEPCVLAGAPPGGVVLDPFGGAGTTGIVAKQHGREVILCEINPRYASMARARLGIAEQVDDWLAL
jgi:DNA modification methylase